jgi:hypothetical protein
VAVVDARSAARSNAESDQMPDDIRWIRSYVSAKTDGSVGTVCIYEASSPDAIREHARRGELPADEIIVVADTVTCGRSRSGLDVNSLRVAGARKSACVAGRRIQCRASACARKRT